uniref:Uncharacterized protein n=1 Tax=Melanopsichium pennsylvanicum 4 TaxID=1398559 RepID=A0A077R9D8_9BASI|nr:uncharacterized protein BN887_06221 [Melanopsichium pennsylvanicum 4]
MALMEESKQVPLNDKQATVHYSDQDQRKNLSIKKDESPRLTSEVTDPSGNTPRREAPMIWAIFAEEESARNGVLGIFCPLFLLPKVSEIFSSNRFIRKAIAWPMQRCLGTGVAKPSPLKLPAVFETLHRGGVCLKASKPVTWLMPSSRGSPRTRLDGRGRPWLQGLHLQQTESQGSTAADDRWQAFEPGYLNTQKVGHSVQSCQILVERHFAVFTRKSLDVQGRSYNLMDDVIENQMKRNQRIELKGNPA